MIDDKRKKYDIIGLGAITIDLIGRIDHWPEPGVKTQMDDFVMTDGGLAATAIIAASRLGGKVAMAGKLGFSHLADRAYRALQMEGVDVSFIIREKGCEPVISMVISHSDNGERNIFFSRKGVEYPLPEEFNDDQWIRESRILLIDHGCGRAGYEAASLANMLKTQVIIDAERMEPGLEDTLGYCDHIVVSRSFATMYTGYDELKKMLHGLRSRDEQHIVITMGEKGCAGLSGNEHFLIPGHVMDIMDTTGSGDVFHGAYALAIARGESVEKAARYANAAAALSVRGLGGRGAIPDHHEVIDLLGINDRE